MNPGGNQLPGFIDIGRGAQEDYAGMTELS
jgi:hypothetical protein